MDKKCLTVEDVLKMREILFRGKRIDSGEWVQGYFVASEDEAYIFEPKEVKKGLDLGGYLDCCQMSEVAPDTVGQYTGLCDKNGKKIFEGDVVLVTDDDGRTDFSDGGVGDVGFYDGLWYVSGDVNNGLNDLTTCYNVEIIGNIHDNPELLEVGNE